MKAALQFCNEEDGVRDVEVDVPDENLIGIVEANRVRLSADIREDVIKAIENPIASPKLEEICTPGKKVTILCEDITRNSPTHIIIPALIEKLMKNGVPRENVNIVMALGSHRYMTENEMIQKVTEEVYDHFRVENSAFREPDKQVSLGKSPDGVEIMASAAALIGDVRIGVSGINPHPGLGWSGGAKILYPGVCSEQNVFAFHIHQGLTDENYFGQDDCPLRLMVEQWAPTIGLDFIVNTVMSGAAGMYKCVAGHYISAHRKGVEYAKELYCVKIPEPADVVIISGYPYDIDFSQSLKACAVADKGMKGERGGSIIVLSPCQEGIGPHASSHRWIGYDDAHERLVDIKEGRAPIPKEDPVGVALSVHMSKIRQRREHIIVTDGVERETAEMAQVRYYPMRDMQKAVDETLAKYENPRALVVPNNTMLLRYDH